MPSENRRLESLLILKNFLIIDPECRYASGHHFQTSKALSNALSGAQCTIAIHGKAALDLDFGLETTIWRWPENRTLAARLFKRISKSERNIAGLAERNTQTIMDMIARAKLGRGDAVIAHSADRYWPLLANAIEKIDADQCPDFHIRFVHSTSLHQRQRHDLRKLARLENQLPSVNIYCEADETASGFVDIFGFSSVRAWPLPMAIDPSQPVLKKRIQDRCFVVAFLGGKRTEQGVEQIPEIAQHLISMLDGRRGRAFQFLIQKPAADTKKTSNFLHMQEALESIIERQSNGELTLNYIPSALTEDEFREALSQSHLLLLPYDVSAYGNRGSGLIIEGALSSTPIVVTEGFAMAHWQEIAGSPTASSPQEFAKAVLEVASNYERFQYGAETVGVAMRTLMHNRIEEIRNN